MLLGLEMCVKWRLWMIEWILGCLLYESWKKTIIKIEISGPRGKIRVCHIRSNIGLILWHSAILCKKGADCHRKCHHVCPKHIPKPSLQNAPRPLEGTLHFIFFLIKKSCGPFLKSLLNLLQYCFCFMFFFFFGSEVCEILAPQWGIKPHSLHWKANFLTTGPPEKSWYTLF